MIWKKPSVELEHLKDVNVEHTCNLCTKTLSSKIYVKWNMKTHETVRCDLSDFAAKSQKKLEDHLSAIHLGVKNFKYQECDYAWICY
jgi:hypothetical protein